MTPKKYWIIQDVVWSYDRQRAAELVKPAFKPSMYGAYGIGHSRNFHLGRQWERRKETVG